MKVTNLLKLPQAFVNAVNINRHNAKNCYSATTLNKGTKEIILTDRHFDEIEVDASDNIWAIFGTAVHSLLENQKDDNCFQEEKFKVAVSESFVTGQVDSYDLKNETIYDWKTASVWKVQFKDFSDWDRQGATYAWLLKQSGLEVKKVRFVAMLKDHSKTKAKTDPNYPQSPVFIHDVEITPEILEATESRIKNKVQEIENFLGFLDDEIPPCTKEERWADDDKWAVMKDGRKSAVKLFDNDADAEQFAAEQGKGFYIEHRPAVSRKCGEYCAVCQWCNFYKEMQEKKCQ